MPILPLRFGLGMAAMGLLFLGSCSGDSMGRHAITGSVKVDGQPLARGDISIQPNEGQATTGGSEIADGKYSVPKAGGLVAGKYRVEIHAPVPGTGGQADENSLPGDPPAPPKELIPSDWNSASTQTIEVKKQGANVFDFDVPTKKGPAKKS
jgi:hypothetical protein